MIKVKFNKRDENEFCECKKKVPKSKIEELRKGLGKIKRNDTKEEHEKLVEKIKMRQRRAFPFFS